MYDFFLFSSIFSDLCTISPIDYTKILRMMNRSCGEVPSYHIMCCLLPELRGTYDNIETGTNIFFMYTGVNVSEVCYDNNEQMICYSYRRLLWLFMEGLKKTLVNSCGLQVDNSNIRY